MAVITTSSLNGVLPLQTLQGVAEATKYGSTIAALSQSEPMLFGSANIIQFGADPKAEFVEEGGAKSQSDATITTKTAVPHKAVVTVRVDDEFMWADEDYQLGIIRDKFVPAMSRSVARALDLGAYYRINPKTGTVIAAWTNYMDTTTNRVEVATAAADIDIETAVGLILEGGNVPTGLALTPQHAFALANLRDAQSRKLYPELGFGVGMSQFNGLRASVSNTVSAQPEAADNKVKAIVGDYDNGIRWGIQKEVPFEVIPYGDPDNTGLDLKGQNQVALRTEVVYAWWVDPAAFAVVENVTP